MSENRLNGRIVNKHDVEAKWLEATNFIPMQGELIVYDPDDTYAYSRQKIGDGVTNVNNLPFLVEPITEEGVDEICAQVFGV